MDRRSGLQRIGELAGRLSSVPVWKLCLLVFVLVFAERIWLAFGPKRDLTNDRCEVQMVAESVASSGVFGNPYILPTGPTSHCAPAYPFLLGFVYRYVGTGPAREATVQALCCVMSALEYALLPLLTSVAGLGVWTGLLAGLAGGLVPVKYWVETKCVFGEPYQTAILVVLCVLTMKRWMRRDTTIRLAILLGVLWGVALLFAPNLLPIFFAFTAMELFVFFRGDRARHMRTAATTVAAIALVLAPWTVRNYVRFHQFIFVRGNVGLELALANTESSAVTMSGCLRSPAVQKLHPMVTVEASRELKRVGEPAFFSSRFRLARNWIISHPGEFVLRSALRAACFWFPVPEARTGGWAQSLVIWGTTLLAFFGFVRMRHMPVPASMIAAIWLAYPLTYYFFAADFRYRYPIEWTVILCAGYGLVSCWNGWFLRERPATMPEVGSSRAS